MKRIYPFIALLILISACRNDNRERIFELFYPNFNFTIPAGQSPFLPYALGIRGVNTNIDFYLDENSTDTALINEITPISARLTSIDGLDYNFLHSVSVRICEDTEAPCRDADEVFYIENLQEYRPDDQINLLPGIRNAKKDLIREEYRLEILFFLAFTPSFDYETRLDMTFGAYK